MFWKNAAMAMAVVAGVLVFSGEAQAQHRKQSATFCQPITSRYQDVRSNMGAIGNGGSSPMRLVCPILDDQYLPMHRIYETFVYVDDNSTTGSVDARACISFAGMRGGSCGGANFTGYSQRGMYELLVDPTIWRTYSGEFGYLVINLPSVQNGRASGVHGYWLAD